MWSASFERRRLNASRGGAGATALYGSTGLATESQRDVGLGVTIAGAGPALPAREGAGQGRTLPGRYAGSSGCGA